MTAASTGSEFLAKKSDLAKSRQALASITDVLLIDDNTFDADRLRATLHIMLGYGIQVRRAKTIGGALDYVIERRPELIFLDDVLPPSDTATTSTAAP